MPPQQLQPYNSHVPNDTVKAQLRHARRCRKCCCSPALSCSSHRHSSRGSVLLSHTPQHVRQHSSYERPPKLRLHTSIHDQSAP